MSDEPPRYPTEVAPADGIHDHRCEHPNCEAWASFGFSRPKHEPHWFCYEHRAEGERFL